MLENNNIFDESSGCIRQGILLKYLKGQLSGKERNLVERHLLECEMCSDEFEGLSNLSEPERIIEIEAELNSKVDSRTVPRIIRFNSKIVYRVAAAALLTFGVSSLLYFFVLRNTFSTMMTENQKLESVSEIPDSQSSKMDVTSVTKDVNEFKKIEREKVKKVEKLATPVIMADKIKTIDDTEIIPDSVNEVLAFSEAEVAAETLTLEGNEKKDSDMLADKNVVMAGQKLEEAKTVVSDVQAEESAGAVTERSKSVKKSMVMPVGSVQRQITTEGALISYNQKNYQKALQDFNALYAQNVDSDTLIYYRAMCMYQLDSYAKAIEEFEKLSQKQTSVFYFDSQWYLALSFARVNRIADARKLFEIIATENSKYSNNAKLELEKLN